MILEVERGDPLVALEENAVPLVDGRLLVVEFSVKELLELEVCVYGCHE